MRALFSNDHKSIGLRFLWLALFSVVLGMTLSLAMRIQLSQAGGVYANADRYAQTTLLHGSLMVFFVLTAAPQCGFGYFLVPLQIGAREMALPLLSGLSFWMSAASLITISISILLRPANGSLLWFLGVLCFCGAMILASLNIAVTVIELRAKGMTLPRLPITVWAWFVNAILSMLIFSVLLAGCTAVLSDRLLGTHFFSAAAFLAQQPQNLVRKGSLPVLWQRLFWYFAQAEVYVAMLPCFGIITHLVATFARRPV